MRFAIALGLAAALVLAGAAGAQGDDHCPPPASHTSSAGDRGGDNRQNSYNYSGSDFRPRYFNVSAQNAYRERVKAYNMACTADRVALCAGRNSASAAWECIRIRRSKLSEPCREATYAVERASADANF